MAFSDILSAIFSSSLLFFRIDLPPLLPIKALLIFPIPSYKNNQH